MVFSQSQPITKSHENAIEEILTYINYNRTKKFSIILFFVTIILLFIDYLNKAEGLWTISDGYRYLFYSHLVLGLVPFFYSLVFYKITVRTPKDITLYHKLSVNFFAFFILNLTAIISGWIDQKIHGQITVYIIGCFLIAVMYSYKPRVTAFLYGSSWGVFIIFLTISQKNIMIRQGHYVNISIFVAISYFLSTVLYRFKQQELLYKHCLEDLVNERTEKLQTTNDLLSQKILERKQAEIEIAKLDRLNLVGEMAASISHEVRNPMTTVKGFLQLLRNKQDSKGKEYFDLMIEELDRANSILSEFLSISKPKSTIFEWHDLNDIVTSTLPLIQADAQTNDNMVTVELNNIPDLLLNLQEIRQLLLNLVRNGLEAMSDGGQLKIRTFATDSEVVLAVSDEGKGIEESTLEKLGTPFFTTKEQGTGLGLAVCYGIVSRHNGRISVETSALGSTFYTYFKSSNLKRQQS